MLLVEDSVVVCSSKTSAAKLAPLAEANNFCFASSLLDRSLLANGLHRSLK